MSVEELIRCRVRYFTDGAVIGSKAFVAEQWDVSGSGNDPSKKRRLNSIPELPKAAAIFSLRQLRVDGVVSPGG